MNDFDEQDHRAAYDAMAKGDTGPVTALVADDYVHHMTAWGLTVRGRDRTRALVDRIFERMQITEYQVDDVKLQGEFVVTFISGRSALREDEFHGVDVVRRGPDGMALEGWSHRPPLPEGIDARQVLGWHD
jgi:hypothetical protein